MGRARRAPADSPEGLTEIGEFDPVTGWNTVDLDLSHTKVIAGLRGLNPFLLRRYAGHVEERMVGGDVSVDGALRSRERSRI